MSTPSFRIVKKATADRTSAASSRASKPSASSKQPSSSKPAGASKQTAPSKASARPSRPSKPPPAPRQPPSSSKFHPSDLGALTSRDPVILADSNRDGIVSHQDWQAPQRRSNWTDDFGAIYLPNIGHSTPFGEEHFGADGSDIRVHDKIMNGHDAHGNELVQPGFAAPLRTVPIPNCPPHIRGRFRVVTSSTSTTIQAIPRLFVRLRDGNGGQQRWMLVDESLNFDHTALAAGLILALDGRAIITDSRVWDGVVKVIFETGGPRVTRSRTDTVALRMAPVLLHHNLQPAERLITRKFDEPANPSYLRGNHHGINDDHFGFMRQIIDAGAKFGVPVETVTAHTSWFRDHMAVGYCTMPGPAGPVSLRVLVMLPSEDASINAACLGVKLCGPDTGAHYLCEIPVPEAIKDKLAGQDSGGNIDVIPPYTSKSGKHWPNGRAVMLMGHLSRQFAAAPDEKLKAFLNSQGSRGQGPPLNVYADLTAVAHIDEIVTFIPDPRSKLGFTVAVIDPEAGLDLLRRLKRDKTGHREVPAFPVDDIDWKTMPKDGYDYGIPGDIDDDMRVPWASVDEFLGLKGFIDANKFAARSAKRVLDAILGEVPIEPRHVLRLPVLVWPRQMKKQKDAVIFVLPNPVNGVVLGNTFLAPRQYGPVRGADDDDGAVPDPVLDVFREQIVKQFRTVKMEVHFVDDFLSHHVQMGDVHCATNTYRGMAPWWS